jgi:FkbM family methyltransferase
MAFVSFAQNYEDVMLWRALNRFGPGFYIDIGASDPVIDSVTKAFYEHGWHGINVEPMKEPYNNICKDRTRDINLNIGIDKQNGTKIFYSIDAGNGLSTSVKDYADEYTSYGKVVKTLEIETKTLAFICNELVNEDIHFLKVDVEGSEQSVLEGADFTKYRPWIVLVEATKPNTTILAFHNWEHLLLISDYTFVYFDGLNRFYIANEKLELLQQYFAAPPNYFDFFVLYKDSLTSKQLDMVTQEINDIAEFILHNCSQNISIINEKENAEAKAKTISMIRTGIESLASECVHLKNQEGVFTTNIDSLTSNIDLLTSKNDALIANVEGLNIIIGNLTIIIDDLTATNKVLTTSINMLEQQKTAFLQSHSWRITKILRAVSEKLRRLHIFIK